MGVLHNCFVIWLAFVFLFGVYYILGTLPRNDE
jgi:hypothetical protein